MIVGLALTALLLAQAPAPPKPPPTDAECRPLPALHAPWAFGAGESLDFDLDALGAQAGKLTMRVLPEKDGLLPVEARAQTNTFFAKIRRVNGVGTSYLNAKTLHPTRYVEDATENEVRKTADVTFSHDHRVKLDFRIGDAVPGQGLFHYANDGLDVAGAIYAMRQLPLKEGMNLCFDVYGIRSLWRLSGKVEGREHVSLPVGEFEAWHLSGVAVKLDDIRQQRGIHLWLSDDGRRLPLAALGVIDLGAIRATLTAYNRPGDKRARAENKGNIKW
jgi:hypothetical protein